MGAGNRPWGQRCRRVPVLKRVGNEPLPGAAGAGRPDPAGAQHCPERSQGTRGTQTRAVPTGAPVRGSTFWGETLRFGAPCSVPQPQPGSAPLPGGPAPVRGCRGAPVLPAVAGLRGLSPGTLPGPWLRPDPHPHPAVPHLEAAAAPGARGSRWEGSVPGSRRGGWAPWVAVGSGTGRAEPPGGLSPPQAGLRRPRRGLRGRDQEGRGRAGVLPL